MANAIAKCKYLSFCKTSRTSCMKSSIRHSKAWGWAPKVFGINIIKTKTFLPANGKFMKKNMQRSSISIRFDNTLPLAIKSSLEIISMFFCGFIWCLCLLLGVNVRRKKNESPLASNFFPSWGDMTGMVERWYSLHDGMHFALRSHFGVKKAPFGHKSLNFVFHSKSFDENSFKFY